MRQASLRQQAPLPAARLQQVWPPAPWRREHHRHRDRHCRRAQDQWQGPILRYSAAKLCAMNHQNLRSEKLFNHKSVTSTLESIIASKLCVKTSTHRISQVPTYRNIAWSLVPILTWCGGSRGCTFLRASPRRSTPPTRAPWSLSTWS